MADLPIHNPLDYSEEIRKLEPTDPDHADTWNVPYERLINNDAFIKALVDRLMSKTQGHKHAGIDGDGPKLPLSSIDAEIVTAQLLQKHVDERNPHGTRPQDIGAAPSAHTHNASTIPIADTGNLLAATNVEDALAEIAGKAANAGGLQLTVEDYETVSAGQTVKTTKLGRVRGLIRDSNFSMGNLLNNMLSSVDCYAHRICKLTEDRAFIAALGSDSGLRTMAPDIGEPTADNYSFANMYLTNNTSLYQMGSSELAVATIDSQNVLMAWARYYQSTYSMAVAVVNIPPNGYPYVNTPVVIDTGGRAIYDIRLVNMKDGTFVLHYGDNPVGVQTSRFKKITVSGATPVVADYANNAQTSGTQRRSKHALRYIDTNKMVWMYEESSRVYMRTVSLDNGTVSLGTATQVYGGPFYGDGMSGEYNLAVMSKKIRGSKCRLGITWLDRRSLPICYTRNNLFCIK